MSKHETQPYRLWSLDAPFRKNGTPVIGTMGSSVRRVVVMEAATFQRMVKEYPALATARFEVGSYDEAEPA